MKSLVESLKSLAEVFETEPDLGQDPFEDLEPGEVAYALRSAAEALSPSTREAPVDISGVECQEVVDSFGDMLIYCRRPGSKVVWHGRRTERPYVFCDQCAYHNIKNRGGKEMVPK